MSGYSSQHGVNVTNGQVSNSVLVHRARNLSISRISKDADYALMVDDDMQPPPDALVRLLSLNRPVCSALCTTKKPPIRLVISIFNHETQTWCGFNGLPKLGSVMEGNLGVGAAFMLLRRDAIEALSEYWLTARDWLEENRKCLDRMHVRAEQREAERARKEAKRRGLVAEGGYPFIFRFSNEDETEVEVGEDKTMCRNLMALGIPVVVDTGCIVPHLGEHPFTVHDVPGLSIGGNDDHNADRGAG